MDNYSIVANSVAIFFRRDVECISSEWLLRAISLFEKHRLSPMLFTAFGGKFLYDDCYVLAERGKNVQMWSEDIPAAGEEILADCRRGIISSLNIDTPQDMARSRSEWRATIAATLHNGQMFLGVGETIEGDPRQLTFEALSLAREVFPVQYGFAYKMPLNGRPRAYADGTESYIVRSVNEAIRKVVEPQSKSADEQWHEELRGAQRHLTGLFRAAYPINVLSRAHVEGAGLETAGIGKLSQLENELWLWELAPEEIADGELWLEQRRVLVRQHAG